MDSRNIRIATAIFEARYEPKVKVAESFGKFQEIHGNEFKLAEYDPTRIMIANHNNTQQKFLSFENTGITNTPFIDKRIFNLECKEMIKFSSNEIGISNFKRLGVRTEIVVPVKESELPKETLNFITKLFGNNATKQLGKAIGDFQLSFGTMDTDINHKVSLRFAKRELNDPKIPNDLPNQGLIVDIDCYSENEDFEDALIFIDNAIDSSITKIRNFLSNFLVRSER